MATRISGMLLVCLMSGRLAAQIEPQPDPDRGLYAIWARDVQTQGLEFLHGGQIMLQWQSLQTGPGLYDFRPLDEALRRQSEAGHPATIQVNGNLKPDFLYETVPVLPEKLSSQIRDRQGSLMYWHPNHVTAYLGFIDAFGRHIRQSPHRRSVLGVRLNFNALGTEHMSVPAAYRASTLWKCPPGVEAGANWNAEVMQDYRRRVITAFSDAFLPDIRVFVRNNVAFDESVDADLLRRFDTGDLALFHTSSEIQPRSKGTERQYAAFLRWARTGKTLAYAESWADAWGRHGAGMRDDRWCSPCQWNYWRLLIDLHCGVSFIAVYGADLEAAQQETEFRDAFTFAARYAGYHASPSQAPGAWIALREGEFLAGDYTFLMERLPDHSQPVKLAGPTDQRFGAWARRLPAGESMVLRVDQRWVVANPETPLVLRVTYLDNGAGSLEVTTRAARRSVEVGSTGRWKTAEWSVSAADLARDEAVAPPSGDVTLTAVGDGVTLHMVEVCHQDKP